MGFCKKINNNNVYNDNRFFNWKLMVEVFFYVFMFGLYSGGDKNGCQSLGNHMPMIGMGDV